MSSFHCVGLICVAGVGETFILEPGEQLLKVVASFQVSLLPKELVISGASCVPGKTKHIFQVIAVLEAGGESAQARFNVGSQLWGQFSNPVLAAERFPNVVFWSADVAESFQWKLLKNCLWRMQRNVSKCYHGATSILLLSRKNITQKI